MPNYSTESSEEEVSEEGNQNYINDLSVPTTYDDDYNNIKTALVGSSATQFHIEKYTFGLMSGLAISYCCRHLF